LPFSPLSPLLVAFGAANERRWFAGGGYTSPPTGQRGRIPFYVSFTNSSVVFVYIIFFLKRDSTIRIHYREPTRRSIEGTS
jgi:hypothetical protein